MMLKMIKFKSVKSTNDEAIKLIQKNGNASGLIVSDIQKKGKGTMGKKWVSKKGNLFFSILFEINDKKINFRHYAILNAYLLKGIISKEISKKIKIKWPNDLLYNKNKICGILQEVVNYNGKKFLVVGAGINTNFSPPKKGFLSTSLKDIANKNIDNIKLINKIKNVYENFLTKVKRHSYSEIIKNISNI